MYILLIPNCAWERGLNENTNGLLRPYFPKGTNFKIISDAKIRQVEKRLNQRPIKALGFRIPQEIFDEKDIDPPIVHLKVETTFSLAEADVVHVYRQDCCPTCADAALVPLAGGPIHYQYALIEKPIFQQARHAQSYWCVNCDTMSTMTLSTGLRPTGLVGPRLTGLIGFLKASERLL